MYVFFKGDIFPERANSLRAWPKFFFLNSWTSNSPIVETFVFLETTFVRSMSFEIYTQRPRAFSRWYMWTLMVNGHVSPTRVWKLTSLPQHNKTSPFLIPTTMCKHNFLNNVISTRKSVSFYFPLTHRTRVQKPNVICVIPSDSCVCVFCCCCFFLGGGAFCLFLFVFFASHSVAAVKLYAT